MGLVDVAKVIKLGTLERKLQPERRKSTQNLGCLVGMGRATRGKTAGEQWGWRVRVVEWG